MELTMSAQPHDFVAFARGETVTLSCSLPQGHDNYFSWFRQAVGRPPVCMLTMYAHSQEATFYGEFKNDSRFNARRIGTMLSLTISNPRPEDAGMYYCAARDYDLMVFGGGTFLAYEGEETRNRHFIQKPVSEPVQPGDSVTLQCTIDTETCAGEHSVYWFRQGSGESSPGIIYAHGNRTDQCERSSGTGFPTQSCVYKLPKRNLSPPDAGTYYCAVATCGEILFGNGTSIEILGNQM
ncbi:T cell receptor beta chain MC.7.G5-like [Megalops cyprinoides]|uniref:T cell receptor beta chain MC.7.G5-like n=1 Tax=Megalops cyprinoides TaxID=118141 RepID=UPI0018647A07|nr:T cell receptor beta chain MC.7.G5-like [Megalops cyprinoides]